MYLTCIYLKRFIMLKRHLLLASLLAGTFAVTACSQQTEEQADAGNVEAAAESAGDDIAANTQDVAADADVAAQDAAAQAADGAKTAAAVTAGAAVNAGEAIADGTNAAVEGTASAVADGANAVADGAQNVAADAASKGKTDLEAAPAVEEAVAEDQKY
jgi:hypothetical protein